MIQYKPIIIEFAGLPGSGKSSVVREVEKRLKCSGYEIQCEYIVNATRLKRFFEKIFTFIATFFRRPAFSVRVMRACFKAYRSKKRSVRDIINVFYLLHRYHLAKKKSTPDIWIFDQGLIQAYWSLLMFGDKHSELLDLLRHEIGYVVMVNTNPKVAWERLSDRAYKGSRAQQQTDNEAYFEKGVTAIEKITIEIQEHHDRDHYLVIHNNKDLGHPSSAVTGWIIEKIKSESSDEYSDS